MVNSWEEYEQQLQQGSATPRSLLLSTDVAALVSTSSHSKTEDDVLNQKLPGTKHLYVNIDSEVFQLAYIRKHWTVEDTLKKENTGTPDEENLLVADADFTVTDFCAPLYLSSFCIQPAHALQTASRFQLGGVGNRS